MSHILPIKTFIEDMKTSQTDGLSAQEAEKRLGEYGPNTLPEAKRTPLFLKFLAQFKDILVVVLMVAATVSYLLGERLDAVIISVIVVINALLGFIQEARAEKAIEALKTLSMDYAKVIRDGEIMQIEATELVPGDLLIIETGDKTPADARLIETVSLDISEAVLTGESNPVRKDENVVLQEKTYLAERKNMVFKDTTVLFGRGRAIVMATGLNTEMGKISQMIQKEEKDESPLAEQLDKVGKKLSLAVGIIIVLIFLIGVFLRQTDLKDAFFTSVSLAVAAIPEGLPAIVTIVLATGMSRLAKSNAIVKRLKAVETLGATNYILTDKTGTLTLNKMTVTDMVTPNLKCSISEGCVYRDDGDNKINPMETEEISFMLEVAVVCNDAEVNEHSFIGDPTETALLEVAQKTGLDIKKTREEYARLYEIPFSSETKKMLVVTKNPKNPDTVIVMCKGAPEITQWMVIEENELVQALNENLAKYGLRNLAFSYKEIDKETFERAKKLANPEDILSVYHNFAGIVSQKDPTRSEVKEALSIAKHAGVKTIMITGDNKLTAKNVAMELELISSEKEVMDGMELNDTDGKELQEILERIKVFARVTPEQKLRITNALKDQDFIVAVTGDGVNDAPAIKAADIGISMGITGTDVSKEVADMVLQDDNYATIVSAIRQGRVIYANLVKFIRYLISCNISEITVIGLSLVVGLPLPLLPIHILWVNLVTDGLPALALSVEPAEHDVMAKKPRNHYQQLLTSKRWKKMFFESALISIATFVIFIKGLDISLEVAQTAAFTTLVFSQLFHALNNRSEKHSIFSKELSLNKILILTLIFSFILQGLIIYTPIGKTFIKTASLSPTLFLSGMLIATLPIFGSEFAKAFSKPQRSEKITSIWK